MQSAPASCRCTALTADGQTLGKSLVQTLVEQQSNIADQVVPWYLNNFSASYWQEVGEATRMEHLKGIVALKAIDSAANQNISLTVTSQADGGFYTEITVMRKESHPGTLHDMLRAVQPAEGFTLHRVKAFTSNDESLTLNIFTYAPAGEEPPQASRHDAERLINEAVGKRQHATSLFDLVDSKEEDSVVLPISEEKLLRYVSLCQPNYVRNTTTHQFLVQRDLYLKVAGTEGVEVHVEQAAESDPEWSCWLRVAAANVIATELLSKITAMLLMRGMSILRMHFDFVKDPATSTGNKTGAIAIIRLLVAPAAASSLPSGVHPFPGTVQDFHTSHWMELKQDMKRLKWLDDVTMELAFKQCPKMGMHHAEILSALCALLHGPLHKVNQYAFSRQGLLNIVSDPLYTARAVEIADLFIARFKPGSPLMGGAFDDRAMKLRSQLQKVQEESARTALLRMVDAVAATLRTNFFVPNRYALALRLDPSLMINAGDLKPFGVFFVHGAGFDGFHNRFSNIARGGLRLVTPGSKQQHEVESARCYDEVYALSRAQELKNKDIPEGGAKAVVLVDITKTSKVHRYHALRNAVKSFTNALLDLIVTNESIRRHVVDHLGVEELIYLGPDEQVVPEDIDWIIKQAKVRGYPMPTAFMSSKPLAGINHKQYGVTSEGVVVFLDVALRDSGIDPTSQPFTVKMTGGPDGDVGGNFLRILFRDFGENARIVGIADGSGCAEDPSGLPHDELMRLFYAGLPIASIARESLSATGVLHVADTAEGAEMRNTMHNRLKADVFVPAGGRPNTINAGNWANFLDAETGAPSSPLIVEGANIFLTKEARLALHEKAGVRIVKDSSANKCGVITSSYEICASMLLSEEEFLSVKEELVANVLSQLRHLARSEAELMFREFRNYPGPLPYFSERISQSILRAKGAFLDHMKDMQRGDEKYVAFLPLFLRHLPAKLVEVAADRIDERIPLDYMRYAFASCLASKLLYAEGIHFLESQPLEKLPELAMRYMKEEQKVDALSASLRSLKDLSESQRDEILQVLQRGGVRTLLNVY
mmetsp:Transcript_27322/g.63685  ORF Transcript_27322/g.63685 Transcript_27322/m.63685 type:complete len:1051 (-) Transcript_27322:351-3503(-)